MADAARLGSSNYLAIYLNDHLAAATLLVEVVERAAREYQGTELGAFLAGLRSEVRADRRALRDVMASVDAQPRVAKVAAAWLAEKAGRLKLNGRVVRRSPLAPVVELEVIAELVQGNLLLWRLLRVRVAHDARASAAFDGLAARAEAQLAAVEPHRIAAGLRALRPRPARIGIIGSGKIGGTLTRRLRALGHPVSVANARGPESLEELAAQTGAQARTVEEAVRDSDVVVVAIPLAAVPDLPAGALAGKLVVDANNYYPSRDGQIADVDSGMASSRWVARQLPDATVVKAFNTLRFDNLMDRGRPVGDAGRIGMPVAADDPAAGQEVMALVDELGFDAVAAGGLDDSWRQEPETPVHGASLDARGVREALASAAQAR